MGNKRTSLPRRSKQKKFELVDDDSVDFYCSYCNRTGEGVECHQHSFNLIHNSQAKLNSYDYATKTLPVGLVLLPSSLGSQVGLGVFSIREILQNTQFDAMEGTVVKGHRTTSKQSEYSWTLANGDSLVQLDEKKSDWTRYVNSTADPNRLNLVSRQIGADLFYISTRTILPCEELLSFYGEKRHRQLERKVDDSKLLQTIQAVDHYLGYKTTLKFSSPPIRSDFDLTNLPTAFVQLLKLSEEEIKYYCS